DLNATPCQALDRSPPRGGTDQRWTYLLPIINTLSLTDAICHKRPSEAFFTWRSQGLLSRIDHVLCTTDLLDRVDQVVLDHHPQSDHHLVSITVQWGVRDRLQRPSWKLNTTYLTHDKLQSTYLSILAHEDPTAEYHTDQSKCKAWDRHKVRLQRFATNYGIRKTKANDLRRSTDTQRLEELEASTADLTSGPARDSLMQEML
ncbi:hypothetical protein GGI05_002518, partial [Coemansia sp. RSA 2603]